MPAFKNITGQRLGRLVALRPEGLCADGHARWLCQCDCGNKIAVRPTAKSCGCFRRDRLTTHGQSASLIYDVWTAMHQRCRNPKNKNYKDYGGRGVTVCDRWNSFADFFGDILAEIGERAVGMTLDRIDNDGNYEPGNVRWATPKQQRANQRKPYR